MDDLLPSYESAVKQDPWELIAPYLPSESLCAAALVCQRWHEIFAPHLWGNPASHFGVQNDTVYVALTRFRRTLYWSRVKVRELTHTLHLPPAHAEMYSGPHYEWLRDCLERLPRIQSLIVNGLPFFDHASLLTLRHSSIWWRQSHPNTFPVFGLRLLDASGCSNVTSTGLAEALPHFPDLVSLDLSGTIAARDNTVLGRLEYLRNLRILKLRALGLKDPDIAIVASATGTRVRSIDLRDNQLTDASARLLLEYCLKETNHANQPTRGTFPLRSPVRDCRPQGEVYDFAVEDLDGHLRKMLKKGFVGSLAIEEARDLGITHLYLSNNEITVEGISGLLRSRRLQVLDIGTLPQTLRKPQPTTDGENSELHLPGVEKLTPIFSQYAAERLVYLRVNHAVVTKDAPMNAAPFPRIELEGDSSLHAPCNSLGILSTENSPIELDQVESAIYELQGDSVLPPIEAPTCTKIHEAEQGDDRGSESQAPLIAITSSRPIKRGSEDTPETVLPPDPPLSPDSTLVDASGGLLPLSTTFEGNSQLLPISDVLDGNTAETSSRHNSIHFVEDRRVRLEFRQSQENRLHPGMLPKVHTLVLTDVPSITRDAEVPERIIKFIEDCAKEVEIAKQRASHTYMLPPGRSRKIAECEYAKNIFALRRIILEVVPPRTEPKKITTSWRAYPTKSSTEDTDSEAFWEAATHDFSFFNDEECGLPTLEPGRGPPLAAMSCLQLDDSERRVAPPPKPRQHEPALKPTIDVVGEIAKFRKGRKAAYEAVIRIGDMETEVEGYWPGDITVVRKQYPDLESVDYYGNKFESGWLYR